MVEGEDADDYMATVTGLEADYYRFSVRARKDKTHTGLPQLHFEDGISMVLVMTDGTIHRRRPWR